MKLLDWLEAALAGGGALTLQQAVERASASGLQPPHTRGARILWGKTVRCWQEATPRIDWPSPHAEAECDALAAYRRALCGLLGALLGASSSASPDPPAAATPARSGVDQLLAALEAAARPSYGLREVAAWERHRAETLARHHGVALPAVHHRVLILGLPHPLDGFLEAGLLVRWYEDALAAVTVTHRAARRVRAVELRRLAVELWGELPVVVEGELALDPSLRPDMDALLDAL